MSLKEKIKQTFLIKDISILISQNLIWTVCWWNQNHFKSKWSFKTHSTTTQSPSEWSPQMKKLALQILTNPMNSTHRIQIILTFTHLRTFLSIKSFKKPKAVLHQNRTTKKGLRFSRPSSQENPIQILINFPIQPLQNNLKIRIFPWHCHFRFYKVKFYKVKAQKTKIFKTTKPKG